jgi:hypothetical protein
VSLTNESLGLLARKAFVVRGKKVDDQVDIDVADDPGAARPRQQVGVPTQTLARTPARPSGSRQEGRSARYLRHERASVRVSGGNDVR